MKFKEDRFATSVDPICSLWSISLAVDLFCKEVLGIEVDACLLMKKLEKEGIEKLRECNDFKGFHPLDFDNLNVPEIQDNKSKNYYRLSLNVNETNFNDELSLRNEHNNYTVYVKDYNDEEIFRCMFVIQLSQTDNENYYSCVDKIRNPSNNPFVHCLIPFPHDLVDHLIGT